MKLKEINKQELPREKVIKDGIESLSNNELMTLIIRCGTKDKNAIELSYEILNLIESFPNIHEITISDLMSIKGMGLSKASLVLASIELGYRLNKKELIKNKFVSPQDIFNHFKSVIKTDGQERLYAVFLNTKGYVIKEELITVGSINQSIFDSKLIFKLAYNYHASGIILVHNHPSGDATPSMEDINQTKLIIEQAKLLKFIILDHIIIGNNYFSMREKLNIFN